MLSVLKPNKANVVGTLSLLVANWIAGFVPRLIMPLLMAENGMGGAAATGRGAFAAGSTVARSGGSGFTGGGVASLVGSAVGLIVTALLFYVILSFVVAKLAKPEVEKAETKKK
jgi:hypothetical protein